MTYPRRHLHDGEEILDERGLHLVVLLPRLVVVVLVFAGLGAGFFLWKSSPTWFGLILGVIFVFTLSYLFAIVLRFRSTGVVLTSERLIYRAGVLRRRSTDIPIISIVEVTTLQPILKRVVGVGDVVIRTAQGQVPITIADLTKPKTLVTLILHAREQAEQARVREVIDRNAPVNVAEEYQRLVALHRTGVLTQIEFESRVDALGAPRGEGEHRSGPNGR